MDKTAQARVMELETGRDLRLLMQEAYRRGGGLIGGASILKISPSTFQSWIRKAGGHITSDLVFDAFPQQQTAGET